MVMLATVCTYIGHQTHEVNKKQTNKEFRWSTAAKILVESVLCDFRAFRPQEFAAETLLPYGRKSVMDKHVSSNALIVV